MGLASKILKIMCIRNDATHLTTYFIRRQKRNKIYYSSFPNIHSHVPVWHLFSAAATLTVRVPIWKVPFDCKYYRSPIKTKKNKHTPHCYNDTHESRTRRTRKNFRPNSTSKSLRHQNFKLGRNYKTRFVR